MQVRDWITKFFLHVATGVLAVGAHYALMALALDIGLTPLLASSVGFLGGAATRFFTAYFHVFSPSQGAGLAVVKFLGALCLQLPLNYVLVAVLMSMGMGVWKAQLLSTVLLTFINYLVYRLWVFR